MGVSVSDNDNILDDTLLQQNTLLRQRLGFRVVSERRSLAACTLVLVFKDVRLLVFGVLAHP